MNEVSALSMQKIELVGVELSLSAFDYESQLSLNEAILIHFDGLLSHSSPQLIPVLEYVRIKTILTKLNCFRY